MSLAPGIPIDLSAHSVSLAAAPVTDSVSDEAIGQSCGNFLSELYIIVLFMFMLTV